MCSAAPLAPPGVVSMVLASVGLRRPAVAPCLLRMVHPVKQPFTTSAYLASTTPRTLAADWISQGIPRWITLIDEALFVLSSAIFVEGSLDFYPGVPFPKYIEGCELFIIGSILNVGLAAFAGYEIFAEARLVGKSPKPEDLAEQALYVAGSLLFLAGTVLFTPPLTSPPLDESPGRYLRRIAGVLEVPWFGQNYQLLLTGGVVPEAPPAALELGDVFFVTGSVLYSIAAFVSSLRAAGEVGGGADAALTRSASVATGSLYQLGGVAFFVGTLGFIPSVDLGISACPDGPRNMAAAGAAAFVAGSGCYLIGAHPAPMLNASAAYSCPLSSPSGACLSLSGHPARRARPQAP